ncbi:NAD(P)-binding protein [Amniculicola lignicola CBS 123094]|uniref:NAD(P)-binding protein n=1 Tax=Amniculicola lignicola CBS 123094 TaxID=1392246 RepID=A0A6A5WXB8_9PLEO|nr:NAD(P)-binding protein [Amniculicola lignicola CBS 123094]
MSSKIDQERDGVTLGHQFTPTMHRQVYPAIKATNRNLSAAGKTVLITGATRGIGKAIAVAWAQAGASSIVITGRAENLLKEVSDELKKISPKTKILALKSEATSEEDAKKVWAKVQEVVGIIDVLICNAGIFSEGRNGLPVTGLIEPSLWWSDLETNVRGPYLQIYHFLQQKLVQNQKPKGTVIILSSAAASFTMPGMSSYALSKLAGARQAEFLHVEHEGVRAFSLHPGIVPTTISPELFQKQAVDPPEMAGGLSLYLATPKAEFLRGSYITVNWDVEEMERNAEEIKEKRLLKTAFLNGQLRPEGHHFEGKI